MIVANLSEMALNPDSVFTNKPVTLVHRVIGERDNPIALVLPIRRLNATFYRVGDRGNRNLQHHRRVPRSIMQLFGHKVRQSMIDLEQTEVVITYRNKATHIMYLIGDGRTLFNGADVNQVNNELGAMRDAKQVVEESSFARLADLILGE